MNTVWRNMVDNPCVRQTKVSQPGGRWGVKQEVNVNLFVTSCWYFSSGTVTKYFVIFS